MHLFSGEHEIKCMVRLQVCNHCRGLSLPEGLLPSRIPYLQLDLFPVNGDHPRPKLHPDGQIVDRLEALVCELQQDTWLANPCNKNTNGVLFSLMLFFFGRETTLKKNFVVNCHFINYIVVLSHSLARDFNIIFLIKLTNWKTCRVFTASCNQLSALYIL